MTAAFQSSVDSRSPAVVRLTGTLDEQTISDAESVLWDVLADMPPVMIIDASALAVSADGWRWLAVLDRKVVVWPGTAVLLAAGAGAPELTELRLFASVAEAMRAYEGDEPGRSRSVRLPAHPDSCGQAREFVAQACVEWDVRRIRRMAELLLSELVANGVRHARTELVVTVRLRRGALEISVRDRSPLDLPVPQSDTRGFGLQLVDQLSESWGWAKLGSGKVVWSQLPSVG